MEKFECSFCGNTVEAKNSKVTSLLVTTNWDMDEEEQQSQQLFCHLECLKKAMNDTSILYVEDFEA